MTHLADERRAPRVPCNLEVEYEIRGTFLRHGRMTNIGPGGALLTTPGEDPPVGADVLVRFHLPLSNRPVRALGKVRWSGTELAGIDFVHLGLQEKDELWRYYARESGRHRGRDAWQGASRE